MMCAVTWFSVRPGLRKRMVSQCAASPIAPTIRRHFLLVDVLDRPRLHHGRHAVGPLDLRVVELVQHVDVDEVDAERLVGHVVAAHLLHDGVGELLDLLPRRRAGGALDPRVRVPDVLRRDPRGVALDLEADVALLEQHRRPVAAQERVPEPGLEPVPPRRQRARSRTGRSRRTCRSSAPRLCAFMRSRARSSRYLRSRSQFTRCCQSTPTVPKFAMAVLSSGRRISAAGDENEISQGACFISAAPLACQTK